uniref:Hypothetical chloroplast RF21 n=1 Tax=Notoscyphus lutescens TaxID=399523 RepID=A0A8F2XW53_9MARC|nr:hypothetical chloroplast RF21 [Notoscyphus lutescens]
MGIYKKSSQNFHNFDIFLQNVFKKKKLFRYESFNISANFNNQIFFGEINDSFEKELNELIYNSNFVDKLIDYSFSTAEKRNLNDPSIRKQILRNLKNCGESLESLVKSSFLLKEKENLYLSNYMKVYLWQFFIRNYRQQNKVEGNIFTGKNRKSSYSILNNSKLYITLKNILSDAICKLSRSLVYEVRESEIQTKKINVLTRKITDDMNPPDSGCNITKNMERNLQFIYFDQFHNLHTDNYHFDWMNKMLYLKYEPNQKSVFLERTFLKKYLPLVKDSPNCNLNFLRKSSIGKGILDDLFPVRERGKLNADFFKPLLINGFVQNIISTKTFTGFLIPKKIDRLKNNIASDDLQIISWKLRKYHSNFLQNYYLPFNFAYNIIHENSYSNEEIWSEMGKKYNPPLVKFLDLPSVFSKFRKTFLLISSIELKEHLLMKTNELDFIIDQSKKNGKNTNFTKKILLIFGKKDDSTRIDGNGSINSYHSYHNGLLKITLLPKVLGFKEICKNNIFHKYSKSWKRFIRKSFIYNAKNIKYKKLSFEIDHWLYKVKGSFKTFVSYNSFTGLKFIKILTEHFKNPSSKNIDEISSQIFVNIYESYVERNKLLTKNLIEIFDSGDINANNFIEDLLINEIIIDLSNKIPTKNDILSDWVGNKKLLSNLNYKFHFDTFLGNFNSNYRKKFTFCWKENGTKNHKMIYSQLVKNLLKYRKLNETFIQKRSLFLGRNIYQLVQLKLNKFFVFEIFHDKLSKTKLISLHYLYEKLLKQMKFYFPSNSKIYFLERRKSKLKTLSTNKGLKIKKIGTGFLADLSEMGIKEYYNMLQSQSSIISKKTNNLIFESINKIYLSPLSKYSKLEKLKDEIHEKMPIRTDKLYDKFNQIEIFNCFEIDTWVKNNNYIDWFFTFEWWEYRLHIFGEILRKIFLIMGSHFEYFINNNIRFVQMNLANLYEEGKKNLYTSNSRWNSRFFFECTEDNIFNFPWSNFYLININNFGNLQWAFFGLIAFVFLFYQNSLSVIVGSDSIDLWKSFEDIKYLTDTSRAFYFAELLHPNKTQLNRTGNFLIHFLSNLKHYAKNIRFYLLIKKNLNNWLINNKSLDLSRRKRNLLVQSLTTPTQMKNYGFHSYFQPEILNNHLFGYRKNSQQGLSYIRYVSKVLEKNLSTYSLHLGDKWIFFASLQKIISSQTLQQTKKFNPKFRKIPISLQLGLSCSKGILLIGPVESGRSYLIKNLAADCSVPLLGISINKLLYNKPDVMTESWMNILIESLRRLNLTLDLAKEMSPCIIWIRNIHELDVNRPTQNIESDPTFLLGILLKHFHTNSLRTRPGNDIVMIGSTHVPTKVDPSLISPDRLDRVINIRLLNIHQRKKQFTIFLKKNNLHLNKNSSCSNEFGSRTMGYNMRDLISFTNEISLINLTGNDSFVYDDTIKLAFHRQIFGFSHTNNKPKFKQNFKILLYRIGRTIIQNILVGGSTTTNPLNISNYLWKKKFYYLSRWYLEPSIDNSIIKESTILIHVLVCLAGVAARDSWFLLEKSSHTSISLDKLIENDLDLAYSIVENFSSDFPWLETCENQFMDYGEKKTKIFLTENFLKIMHSGIFAIANRNVINTQTNSQYESLFSKNKILDRKICEFKNTAWSPRFWRLNFSRSNLFNWVKRPNDFESFRTLGYSDKINVEVRNQNDPILSNQIIAGKKQLFYERILPRVRKRNVEELESQFENILLEEQFEILGFFKPSTQYQMEYQLNNKPKLFIGKRILWDPTGSFFQNRHFVFSRREFFVDREMLRRLYITYGVRRERERSLSNHRIKQFFIHRGYDKDFTNKLSVRWWSQLPIDRKHNIYTLKRIEKMGIRLKRPQIFTPVYLYQRWLIENIPGRFSRLDLVTHRDRWIKINKLLFNDSFTYSTLLESYQYLFEFFSSNKILLTQMIKTLLRKKWLFQNEIVNIIDNMKD